MSKRERTYRGIFLKTDGTAVGLDFYAENLTFARMHALQVANHLAMHVEQGPLTVERVLPCDTDEFRAGDAGAWFPLS
jgi:hypothetical protein